MTNVIFPKKELAKHFNLTKENIDNISLLGTPLESETKDEIEIEVFPNRPDLISLPGFVRAFKAFIGKSTGLKNYKVNKPQKNFKLIVNPGLYKTRPTVCAIVKGIKFNNEKIKDIINLQEKLHNTMGRNRKKMAIGIYPLDKIKLPISYISKNPTDIKFQPLDYPRVINGKQILIKHPAGKKYSHLLKEEKKYPIFIDANSSILSMPPIINSNETGKITELTKDVFIECSGTDLLTLQKALNIIVTTLSDMKGTIYQMELVGVDKIKTPNLKPENMKISLENTNKLLGLNLNESDLTKLLPKMGFNYKSGTVQIPAWRTDILHEVDIIEDIAIAYGYNNFKPEIPKILTIGSESVISKINKKISEILIGLQALEISSYHLIKPQEADLAKIQNPIELVDSKTDYKILRPNLLIPSLRILSENLNVEYPQKIFEIGIVFSRDSLDSQLETGIVEENNLIFSSTPANFTEIKQILHYLMNTLGINYKITESTHIDLIEGRTASIIVNNKPIGLIGEVHPITLRKWGLKMPLAIFEISLEEIYNLLSKSPN